MPTEEQTLDARVSILDFRLEQTEAGLKGLREETKKDSAELRKTLQGIEKNLQAIKWVAYGAGLAFASQVIGLNKAIAALKVFL